MQETCGAHALVWTLTDDGRCQLDAEQFQHVQRRHLWRVDVAQDDVKRIRWVLPVLHERDCLLWLAAHRHWKGRGEGEQSAVGLMHNRNDRKNVE